MVNWAISTTQIWGLSKRVRDTDSKRRIPIMRKTKYIENLPTTLFTASTERTKAAIGLGIAAPFIFFHQTVIPL